MSVNYEVFGLRKINTDRIELIFSAKCRSNAPLSHYASFRASDDVITALKGPTFEKSGILESYQKIFFLKKMILWYTGALDLLIVQKLAQSDQ